MLRLATWQAGREGVDGTLLKPSTFTPAPAIEVIGQLVDHVREALDANGDLELVETGVARLATVGNGASHSAAPSSAPASWSTWWPRRPRAP